MSKGKKIALGILIAVVAAGITWYFVTRSRYLTVYADELIDNVFDEIYYSEMHPLLFRYTPADMRNLRGFVAPGDTHYENSGKWIVFRPRGDMSYKYSIHLSSVERDWDVLMKVVEKTDQYILYFFYDYDIEEKVLTFTINISNEEDKTVDEWNKDIDAFLKEMGLPEDYLETQSKINLDDLLSHWFDMNNGLSRFSLDDLGDFTIEYEY